jgi:hypothetical protein
VRGAPGLRGAGGRVVEGLLRRRLPAAGRFGVPGRRDVVVLVPRGPGRGGRRPGGRRGRAVLAGQRGPCTRGSRGSRRWSTCSTGT